MTPYVVAWFRYGFEVLAVNEWWAVESTSPNGCIYGGPNSNSTDRSRQPTQECITTPDVLEQFSFQTANFFPDMLIMVGFILAFYFLGLVGLWIRVKRAR